MSSEHKSHIEIKSGSEKNFGITFGIIFFLIGFYPMIEGEGMRLWAVGMALVVVALACLTPKILYVPNKLWFKLGMGLGAVVAPLVIVLVYISTVLPIGLLMRLMGKDLISQKLDKSKDSYWIRRAHSARSMRDQF